MLYNPYNPQIQNTQMNMFVPVHSDYEVVNYPVAPGNSIYFKHETEPLIYIKTMGMSQFDMPKMTRFRLVEENMNTPTVNSASVVGECVPLI